MSGSLINLRVIESSAFIAAPLAGLTLAQYGADVIRVDTIGGGIDYGRLPLMPSGRSLYWTGLNKGKRSVAVDLRSPRGRELLIALATSSEPDGGVFLTNLPAKGMDHAALQAHRPDMISCTIEGNPDGSTAVDYTVNCATGYPVVTGGGSIKAPVNHVLPAWDLACAYQSAFAILAAAERRRRDRKGAELRIALADVAFTTLAHLGVAAEAELLDQDRPSIGNHIYGAFGRDFGTRDGKRVMVAGISAGQWNSLVKACEIQAEITQLEARTNCSMRDEGSRYHERDAIASLIAPWVAARTLEEVKTVFDSHRVCWGVYDTARGLMANDARVSAHNPVWETIETEGVGTHRTAGAVARLVGEARKAVPPAPMLGQDTDAVLHEVLGLGSGEIGRLHDDGIVAGPEQDPTSFHG